jgi:hypothetical protein
MFSGIAIVCITLLFHMLSSNLVLDILKDEFSLILAKLAEGDI